MNPMSCQSFIPATIVVVCMTLGLGGWAPEAAADAPDGPLECIAPVQELDAYRLMRRLSLDLRNHLPTWEELDALGDSATELPDEVIDEYLQSDAFRIVARRFHADLLWPTAQPSKLTIPPFHLTERGGSGSPYDIQGAAGAKRRRAWRGDPDIYCADVEQTEWIEVEGPVAYRTPAPINTWEEDGRTIRQEGYVWVRPYWDPSTEVRVCAYVAQEAEVVPQLDDEGEVVIDNRPSSPSRGEPRLASCIEGEGIIDELCGCGPGLRTCFGPGVENAVKDAIRDQLLRLVDDHTVYGEPYSEMLTTSRTYMNGTLQFWYRHLAMSTSLNREFNRYGLGEALLPDGPVDFTDGTWVAAERNVDEASATIDAGHAGVLTLPAYTLRFQTNRSRANRFRTVFTGQFFVPPEEAVDEGPCDEFASDLTQRCGCRHCHSVLEPMAAAWGVVAEGGSALISDRLVYPIYRPECDPGVLDSPLPGEDGYDALALRSEFCPRFWVTRASEQNAGVLRPYQFVRGPHGEDISLSGVHRAIDDALQGGPRALAQRVIENGQFHSTMVQHIFEHFVGRELILDPSHPDQEVNLLRTLTDEFRAHDSFRAMVRRVVSLDQYRRLR